MLPIYAPFENSLTILLLDYRVGRASREGRIVAKQALLNSRVLAPAKSDTTEAHHVLKDVFDWTRLRGKSWHRCLGTPQTRRLNSKREERLAKNTWREFQMLPLMMAPRQVEILQVPRSNPSPCSIYKRSQTLAPPNKGDSTHTTPRSFGRNNQSSIEVLIALLPFRRP